MEVDQVRPARPQPGAQAAHRAEVEVAPHRDALHLVVALPGGRLEVAWAGEGAEAFLDGPTEEVSRGEWPEAELPRNAG